MKNRHYLTIGLSLALLTFSCEKINDQEQEPLPEQTTQNFHLFAVSEDPDEASGKQSPASRTTNSGMSTLWAAGDQLGIMHGQGSSYTMDGVFTLVDAATGRFNGTLNSGLAQGQSYNWLAIYPYMSTMTTKIADANVVIGGNVTQSAVNSKAHLAGTGLPLWGKVTSVPWNNAPNFTMAHLSTFLEINVTNGTSSTLTVSTIKVILPSGKAIRGTFNVNLTGATPALTNVTVYNEATLTLGSGTKTIAAGNSASFYLPAAPFSLSSGQQIHLEINGVRSTATMAATKNFSMGKMNKLNVTYNSTPNQIYVVDNNGHVLTLSKMAGTTQQYHTVSQTATQNLSPTFRIAEKVTNGVIDASGWVIGGEDYNNINYITGYSAGSPGTPISKPSVYYEYEASKPDGIYVDLSGTQPKMQFVLILDYNSMGNQTDEKVRWVCPMPNNCRVEFLNFSKDPSAFLNTGWFTSINNTSKSATYIGAGHNYEVYYVKSPGWLNLWQLGGSPVMLIGKNSSFPQSPYTSTGYVLREDGFKATTWSTLYMMETTTSNVYKTDIYLGADYAFYFYTAPAWNSCFSGWTSNSTGVMLVGNPSTSYPYAYPGASFSAGVYTLTLNTSTKQATLTKK